MYCPSNPVTSIGPILAVPGIAAALARRRGPVVAVSPVVDGAAVSGPAAALMRAQGLPGDGEAWAATVATLDGGAEGSDEARGRALALHAERVE